MKLYQFFDQDSPEYVILHAQSRAKRGKRPSVSFQGINNPREALKTAKSTLFRNGTWAMLSPRVQALTGTIIMRITDALGLRLLTLEELQQLLDRSEPINSDVRVPLVEKTILVSIEENVDLVGLELGVKEVVGNDLDTLNTQVSAAISTHEASARKVSLIEEKIATLTKPNTVEGDLARRGAIRMAVYAGDDDRVKELADRYLAEGQVNGNFPQYVEKMLQINFALG